MKNFDQILDLLQTELMQIQSDAEVYFDAAPVTLSNPEREKMFMFGIAVKTLSDIVDQVITEIPDIYKRMDELTQEINSTKH